MEVWENLKKVWKHLPAAVPTALLILPNIHLCFYDSIETHYASYFSINLLLPEYE